jgi:hypothetical protein
MSIAVRISAHVDRGVDLIARAGLIAEVVRLEQIVQTAIGNDERGSKRHGTCDCAIISGRGVE